jgi:hypothetical protein
LWLGISDPLPPTAGGTVHGRGAIEIVTRAWFDGFPDVTFTLGTLAIDGECAVWAGDVRGTDGRLHGPADDEPFRLPKVMLCTVQGGLIIHEPRIYDFTGMLIQIGLMKAKPI